MSATVTVNGKEHPADVDPQMPLLWYLRDILELTGTKYGCGLGLCGACTVHIDGKAIRSCLTPVSVAQGKQVTTIMPDRPAPGGVPLSYPIARKSLSARALLQH